MLLTEPDFALMNSPQCFAEIVDIKIARDNAEDTVTVEQAREFSVRGPLIEIYKFGFNVVLF